ncbi:MAG: amino acid permease [Pirellulales bacterium]|nr:amino acid permease [Pirellulales bacterium]
MADVREQQAVNGKFGTFGGVFTPCTLTILGVIMFLRFGYVVGQAGVWATLGIVAASIVITLLTSLSLSAIATNTKVKGGGAYYLISRSLGVEFGGAIGIVFFLAQAISVALYVFGFSEALADLIPAGKASLTQIASFVNLAVFICVFIGAGWTIKVQYLILGILASSLLSFYVGAFEAFDGRTLAANMAPQYGGNENLFTMFALFFPAVTGIMAGANMSGDLRDPAKSIPRGTLAAVGVTGLIYLSEAVFLGCARPRDVLVENTMVLGDIARWPVLVTAGIFAATLSSALGSMMGAPRILQAFARDNVFRKLGFFGAGSGVSGEPRRAIVLTFLISQTCILTADLNTIAPLITMAFLITYGLLNLATFYESATKNPSYRPRFRLCHWSTSLAGAAGCLAVMFLIDWIWASVAIVVVAALHWYLGRKEMVSRWGDLQRGILYERIRKNLFRLEEETQHPKNWRPTILALSGAGWTRPHLAVYGHWFTTSHGILSLGQVIQGDVEDRVEHQIGQEGVLRAFIRQQDLQAFPAVVVAPYLSDGIESLVQCHGLGSLRPNTVLLGWPGDPARAESFAATLRTVVQLRRSIVAVRFAEEPADPWEAPPGTLDVWWRDLENGELMLLLAHLLTKNDEWRQRPIRLLRVIENAAGREEVLRHLTELIDSSRIRATPEVVIDSDVYRAIQTNSQNAAIVFMGFNAPAEGEEKSFFDRMERLADNLPRVVFVDSVGGMSLES